MALLGCHPNTQMIFQVHHLAEQTMLSTLVGINARKRDSERLSLNIIGTLSRRKVEDERVSHFLGGEEVFVLNMTLIYAYIHSGLEILNDYRVSLFFTYASHVTC